MDKFSKFRPKFSLFKFAPSPPPPVIGNHVLFHIKYACRDEKIKEKKLGTHPNDNKYPYLKNSR